MNGAVGLMDGLGLDGDQCIRVIPRQSLHTPVQQEVGLNHVHFWKSVNIRAILKYTGKIPT